MLDGHVHIFTDSTINTAALQPELKRAGTDGGVLLSLPPAAFPYLQTTLISTRERLDNLFDWAAAAPGFYPFYWIDPLEEDAREQVTLAVQRGVAGFKVICNRYYPGDDRAMRVFRDIAAGGKPILFHSGILWDGAPSSKFNRPAEFEALADLPELRFAMAHIAWPWCDELIAVYGKLANARQRRPDLSAEMFIDLTPGTPPVYRHDVLTRLFQTGYPVAQNVFFGTDNNVSDYNAEWACEWVARDNAIYKELQLPHETIADIYAGNLMRFLCGAR